MSAQSSSCVKSCEFSGPPENAGSFDLTARGRLTSRSFRVGHDEGLDAMIEPGAAYKARHAALYDHIERHQGEYVEEIRRFLRIPGFSDTGEGIERSAAAALKYLEMAGSSDAKLVETGGYPVVYGKLQSKNPNAKTLAVYSIYDETPVDASEWKVEPLGAEIVDPARIGLPEEMGSLLCSRAALNHRGPMLAFILAVQAMREVEGDVPVNIVWAWDGEEEIGSPNFHIFLKKYENELMRCDALYGPSMQQSFEGPMVITRGYKGALLFELECKGGDWGGTVDGRHTWAAHAPWVDAPMMRLIHAVGSLFDSDHNMVIDGVAERVVPLLPEDMAEIEALKQTWSDDDDRLMKLQLGVKKFRGGRTVPELVERWVTCVGINVQGIVGGYTGPAFYTMLPQSATAKVDIRLPVGPTPTEVLNLLRAHLDRRGFTEIQIKHGRGYEGYRTSTDDPIVQAAIRAAAIHGVSTSILPSSNAIGPASMFAKPPLNLPSIWTGLGHGERLHQPDEYIRVDAIREFMQFAVTYLHEWAASRMPGQDGGKRKPGGQLAQKANQTRQE